MLTDWLDSRNKGKRSAKGQEEEVLTQRNRPWVLDLPWPNAADADGGGRAIVGMPLQAAGQRQAQRHWHAGDLRAGAGLAYDLARGAGLPRVGHPKVVT